MIPEDERLKKEKEKEKSIERMFVDVPDYVKGWKVKQLLMNEGKGGRGCSTKKLQIRSLTEPGSFSKGLLLYRYAGLTSNYCTTPSKN